MEKYDEVDTDAICKMIADKFKITEGLVKIEVIDGDPSYPRESFCACLEIGLPKKIHRVDDVITRRT